MHINFLKFEKKTWILMGIFLISVLGIIPAVTTAAFPVTGPMVINSPGTYQLVNDISNYNGTMWQNGTEYYEPCIVILSSDVIFDGENHTINGVYDPSRDDQIGIYVSPGLERVSVQNTRLHGFNYGIYYYGVNPFANSENGGSISNNDVSGNDHGIEVDISSCIIINNNTISNEGFTPQNTDGIYLLGSNSNIINGNTANNNKFAGIFISGDDNSVTNNIANNNVDTVNNTGYGILFESGSENTIDANIAKNNNVYGIYLVNSEGNPENVINKNDVEYNGNAGIWAGQSVDQYLGDDVSDGYALITNNTVINNIMDGINLTLTDETNEIGVSNNLIHDNGVSGIVLFGSRYDQISSNTIYNNKYGVNLIAVQLPESYQIIPSDNNNLTLNTIYNNNLAGIYLKGFDALNPVINNTLQQNNVTGNPAWGIDLEYANSNTLTGNIIKYNTALGLLLNGSAYNVIYDNVFNNTNNAGVGIISSPNTWNVLNAPGPNIVDGKSKGGNFWATPQGTGVSQIGTPNAYGFIDANYAPLPGDNVDNFPLANPLKASFNASPITGNKPLNVTFTDNSTGTANIPPGVTTWFWDFGDGNTSTLQNPSYTYAIEGTYNVTLTVTNNGGSSSTIPECNCTPGIPIIVGIKPPVADFTTCEPCGPRYGTFPLIVTFRDLSTGSGPLNYTWDFEGGGVNPADPETYKPNPVHIYTIARNYTVTLTVTNLAGSNTTTKIDYITTAYTPAPVADFTASPQSGTNPLVVVFTDQVRDH